MAEARGGVGRDAGTAILARTYSQAAAIDVLGRDRDLPRAHSGHMTYHFWGAPPEAETLISIGYEPGRLASYYGSIEAVGRTYHPLAPRDDNGAPILVCRDPKASIAEDWETFRRFHHVDEGREEGDAGKDDRANPL